MSQRNRFILKNDEIVVYNSDMPSDEIDNLPEIADQNDFLRYFYERGYWLKIYQIIIPNPKGKPLDLGLPDDYEYTEEMLIQDLRAVDEILMKTEGEFEDDILIEARLHGKTDDILRFIKQLKSGDVNGYVVAEEHGPKDDWPKDYVRYYIKLKEKNDEF